MLDWSGAARLPRHRPLVARRGLPVIDIYQWIPLLYALSAPLLAWLLVLGRRGPRRATRLVALAAALAVLVLLAILAVEIWAPQQIHRVTVLANLMALASFGATFIAGALGTATWVLLLTDAAGDGGGRRRLVLLALIFAVALDVGVGLPLREPLLMPLYDALRNNGGWGLLLLTALQNVAAIAAVVVAFAFPASAPPPMRPSDTPGTSEPTPPAVL